MIITAKFLYKFNLLERFWKERKTQMPIIMSLYFQLHTTTTPEFSTLLSKIQHTLDKYEYKLYMLDKIGHLLPPLNFWDYTDKKLDDWQIKVITILLT